MKSFFTYFSPWHIQQLEIPTKPTTLFELLVSQWGCSFYCERSYKTEYALKNYKPWRNWGEINPAFVMWMNSSIYFGNLNWLFKEKMVEQVKCFDILNERWSLQCHGKYLCILIYRHNSSYGNFIYFPYSANPLEDLKNNEIISKRWI